MKTTNIGPPQTMIISHLSNTFHVTSLPIYRGYYNFVIFSGEDKNSQGAMLHEGSHYFPFEFTLPSHLPSSFKGKHGRLRYFVRMTICTSGGPHPTRTSKFGVQGSLDLNGEPNAAVSTYQ